MTIIEREFHAKDKQAADQIEQIIQQEIIWWDWNCVRKTETEVVLYERMYSDSFELDDKDNLFFRKLVPYLVKGWITIYTDDGEIECYEFDPEKRHWLVRTIEPEQVTKRLSIEVTETFDVDPATIEISEEDYEKLRKHYDTDEVPAVADAMNRLRRQVLEHPDSRRIKCRIMDGEDCMLSRESIMSLKS
ncbi:MAG: hypothetical protein ACI4D6_10155 [Chordicoccus sp.]